MKSYPEPNISISKEEYDQLVLCREICEKLWLFYGPYDFPQELREPYHESVRQKLEELNDFDDSE
jgi:hypothetical protein